MFRYQLVGMVAAGIFATAPLVVDAVELGQPAPDCELRSIGGGAPVDLDQFKGKVLYVDFWASWCPPCARSFPFMNDMEQEFADKGLVVLAINVDEKPEDAKAFLAKHSASFSLAADVNGQCPQRWGVQAMPSSYLVDASGVIRHVHVGFRAGEAEKLRAAVEQLLAERSAMQRSDASDTLP